MIHFPELEQHIAGRSDHRLCNHEQATDEDIDHTDMAALKEARAAATLCPWCQHESGLHSFNLQSDRYGPPPRSMAHLYSIPALYDFDNVRNCPCCRQNPDGRSCRARINLAKGYQTLEDECRAKAKATGTALEEHTGGPGARIFLLADGSIAFWNHKAPDWKESGQLTGLALQEANQLLLERGTPGPRPDPHKKAPSTQAPIPARSDPRGNPSLTRPKPTLRATGAPRTAPQPQADQFRPRHVK